MRVFSLSSRSVVTSAALVGAVGLAALLAFATARGRPGDPAPARASSHGTPIPAKNPERLTLLVDSEKVLGWLSGTDDWAGAVVSVRTGNQTAAARLEKGNTFTWPYLVKEPTRATFTFGKHKQTVTLRPPQKLGPCVFFIADRGVYRPKQTLYFAGYLKEPDARGELVALANRAVEVRLTSAQKSTTAATFRVTSDALGRIDGQYTFSDADALDDYKLVIVGYKGAARIALAEYRKAKIHLKISGKQDGDKLRLRFEAMDYLQRPAPGVRVQFTAQLVRNPAPPQTSPLRTEDFAYADAAPIGGLRPEDLSDDERLLSQVDPSFEPMGAGVGEVVATTEGAVELDGKAGEYVLQLSPSWHQARHALVVQGVLLDATGREVRRTQTIPLDRSDDTIRLTLDKKVYEPDQPINVRAEGLAGKAVLVAMRLSAGPIGQGQEELDPIMPLRKAGIWQTVPIVEATRRALTTATAFNGDTATLQLSEAGAYKLVAVVDRPGGMKRRQEIGCVVQPRDQRPALTLEMAGNSWTAGGELRGVAHGRFAGARVLLTLRDERGYRGWQVVTLNGGSAVFTMPLPKGIAYGCTVEAQYANEPSGTTHVASHLLRVEPGDRLLTVSTKAPEYCGPGETVAVNVDVNRQEPVDLIVSVYDHALTGVRADESVDPRAFYHADDRAHRIAGREVLLRRVGHLSVRRLMDRANERMRKLWGKQPGLSPEQMQMNGLMLNPDDINVATVAALVEEAGVRARPWIYSAGNWATVLKRPNGTLADLLTDETNGFRLAITMVGDTFVLWEDHPASPAQPWRRQGWGFQGFGAGGMNLGGFGGNFRGAANLGVAGGISGFGGGGFAGGMLGGFGGMQGGMSILPGGFGGMQLGMSVLPQAPTGAPSFQGLIGADTDQHGLQVRRDFSDSAYWSKVIRTGANGKARVEFKVPDSLTTWQVVITALSKDLHAGRATVAVRSIKPLMVVPHLPQLFKEGDTIRVTASLVNQTKETQSLRVRLKVDNGEVIGPTEMRASVAPNGSTPVAWTFKPGAAGFTQLLMSAEGPGVSDASLKRLPVRPAAVEQVRTVAGVCQQDSMIEVPRDIDPAKATLEIRFAPTLAADLVDTLDYLVDYPYGCVEQTMSRFLPALLVSRTLKQIGLAHPGLEKRLPGVLDAGVKRLLELQQPDGGWGWNGTGQTHEMMTPYALYGLLLAEQNGRSIGSPDAVKRGLERLRQYVVQQPANADFAYCLYVLCQRENVADAWWLSLDTLITAASTSDYALALALDLAVQKGQAERAGRFAAKLRERAVKENGHVYWRTAGFSRWADDRFEITAVALKALIAHDPNDPLIPGALAFFAATKRGKQWNSTKDTALIVAAQCDYLASRKLDLKNRPRVTFRVNDGAKTAVDFAGPAQTRSVSVPTELLRQGPNRIAFADASPGLLYRAVLRYRTARADAAPADEGLTVRREFWLLDDQGKRQRQLKPSDPVPRGAYLESVVTAKATNNMRYLLVENPPPSGCEVVPADDRRFQHDGTPYVLREDREAHVAYHHEEAPAEAIDRCILHAEMAGDYLVPAARAELMYETTTRGRSGPFALRIVEKEGKPGVR